MSGKIIDNFDIAFSERIVEENNLIDEIFVKFLFASIFKDSQQTSGMENIKIRPRTSKSGSIKPTFG